MKFAPLLVLTACTTATPIDATDAWSISVRMTETMQPIQATQTALPTVMAAAMRREIAQARTAEVIANAMPFVMVIGILFLLFVAIMGLYYLYMRIEWQDRKNGAVNTKNFTMVYRGDAELHDRAPLNIPQMIDIPSTPIIDQADTAEPDITDLRSQAIDLLGKAVELYGQDTDRVPSWRTAGWSSSKWQNVVDYLRNVGGAYSTNAGTHTREPVASVIYRLETNRPTPPAGVRDGD